MKISAIGQMPRHTIQKFPQARKQNFTGFLEKPTVLESNNTVHYSYIWEDEEGDDYLKQEVKYFPFKDESDEQIEEMREKTEEDTSYSSDSGLVHYTRIKKMAVQDRLPFTEAEYKNYIQRRLLSKDELEMEDRLKTLGLYDKLIVPPKKH